MGNKKHSQICLAREAHEAHEATQVKLKLEVHLNHKMFNNIKFEFFERCLNNYNKISSYSMRVCWKKLLPAVSLTVN